MTVTERVKSASARADAATEAARASGTSESHYDAADAHESAARTAGNHGERIRESYHDALAAQHTKAAAEAKKSEDRVTAPARAARFERIGDKHAAAGNHPAAASAYGAAADRYKQAGQQSKADEARDKAGEHDELSHGDRADQPRDDHGRFASDRVARFAEEEEDERATLHDADWAPIANAVVDEAGSVAVDASRRALTMVKLDASDAMFEQVSQDAIDWAKARGAELIGKRWRDGGLVDASDAEDTILDETRDEIRAALAQAIEDGDSAAELADRIEGLGAFSEERAARIAQTELVSASNQGHMAAFRGSGVVQKKSWSTSNEETVCDVCQDNEDAGVIDIDDDFPSGDDAPGAHPGCMCVVVPEVDEQDDEDESGDDSEEDEE